MATLLIATPFVHSSALRTHALISDVRQCQAQKRFRVSCRQASVSASGKGHGATASDSAGIQDEVSVLQSSSTPLVNSSLANWIATFFEKEVHKESPQAVAAPTFQLLEPLAELQATPKLHQGDRRRSERTVVFTEEKARRLRKENRATQTFHDKWYHSAIASRLANPE